MLKVLGKTLKNMSRKTELKQLSDKRSKCNPPKEIEILPSKRTKVVQKTTTQPSNQVQSKEVQVEEPLPSTSNANPIIWEPMNWEETLKNVREMRSKSEAPVDSMGCDKCSDMDEDEKTQRFHKLVALMLSSQTKDETTFEAMKRLKAEKLTPENILLLETSKLEQLLCPVSFYKNKAKYLQKVANILIEKYDSDIPDNIKELVALPGVGPKMAHICMATAWNKITGIGVDVHVHRIANRLRWVPKETKEPEQTRVALEKWLPRDLWSEVNHLLVGFGQTICTPLRPKCGECLNRNICPFASVNRDVKKSTTESEDGDHLSLIKKAKFQKKKINL